MVDEKYLKVDIKSKIRNLREGYQGWEFVRGYMTACYTLGAIEKSTLDELKKLLNEKIGGKI